VAKIMDYGKFKYEEAQKAKEARRNQANTILKEVRFRLKIDVHDYETKMKRAVGFLQAGDKVKAMILFRGREQSRPDQGVRLLQRFAEDVAEFGSVESNPTIDGRNMVMVIGPHKTKATAKAEQNAKQAATRPVRADAPAEAPVVERAPAPVSEPLEASFTKAPAKAPVAKAPVAAPVETAAAQAPVAEAPAAAAAETPTEAPKAAAPKAAPKTAAPKAAAPAAPKAAAPKAPVRQPTPANAPKPKAVPAKPAE
jgi:translation initiation factor IF-3